MSRTTKTLHALLGISLALVDFALFISGLELVNFILSEWVKALTWRE
jgi:hypothetical protein